MQMSWFLFPLILFFIFGPFRRRWRGRPWDWDRSGGPQGQNDPARSQERQDRESRERLREEQIELLESRVNELESRLDYAERLLTQRRESQALPGSQAASG